MQKIKAFINTQREKFKDKTYVFRFFVSILALDIVAFMLLAGVNPLQLLNPVQFLFSHNLDTRPSLSLYFPASILSEDLEKEDAENLQLTKISQRVEQTNDEKLPEDEKAKQNARLILLELVSGPTDLKARRFLPRVFPVRKLWLVEAVLYVDLNPELMAKLNDRQKTLAEEAIRRSITENISAIKDVQLVLSAG
ncbi:MAG: GerMN domain-containing protein [Leptospiraceae bacterium]|nr:GerMN domain-containing protein [Leptospiraceae bacterium]MCB1199369.1 GerMN domain-containing protein [Leptospiraceae bacterium]